MIAMQVAHAVFEDTACTDKLLASLSTNSIATFLLHLAQQLTRLEAYIVDILSPSPPSSGSTVSHIELDKISLFCVRISWARTND
jgi:hypothetical protein